MFFPVLFVERLKDIFVAASSAMGDNSAIVTDLNTPAAVRITLEKGISFHNGIAIF